VAALFIAHYLITNAARGEGESNLKLQRNMKKGGGAPGKLSFITIKKRIMKLKT
jgi:hypothetical protein